MILFFYLFSLTTFPPLFTIVFFSLCFYFASFNLFILFFSSFSCRFNRSAWSLWKIARFTLPYFHILPVAVWIWTRMFYTFKCCRHVYIMIVDRQIDTFDCIWISRQRRRWLSYERACLKDNFITSLVRCQVRNTVFGTHCYSTTAHINTQSEWGRNAKPIPSMSLDIAKTNVTCRWLAFFFATNTHRERETYYWIIRICTRSHFYIHIS